ncbi:MAG: AI-2E family transporter [Epulopiscium sp.]|nr:AI-2E family transporter [Candidatus Epulonipiscium sp.]
MEVLTIRRIEWNHKYFIISFYAFLTIISSILFEKILGNWSSIALGFNKITKILAPILYGIFIAYLLSPGVNWIETKVLHTIREKKQSSKLRRILSIIVMYLIVIGFISIMLIFGLPQIASSISDLIRRIPTELTRLTEFLTQHLEHWTGSTEMSDLYFIEEFINNNLPHLFNTSTNILSDLVPAIYGFSKTLTSGLLNIVLGFVISFYLLNDKENFIEGLKKILFAFLGPAIAKKIISIGKESNDMFLRFFVGKMIDSLIIGILCFIGLQFMKMPYSLLISFIIGITNMIPYFGPFIGAIPAIAIVLIRSPIQALGLAIFIFVLQQFDGIVLGPKILGESTGLSPFWVIFSIIIFGYLFGVLGMFLGVPIFAVLYTMLKRFVERKNIETKEKEL